jgi:HAD superfamily hydrolase (TIGR01509 family)
MIDALLFDCDGTLVDTERDGHRVAFNDTFRALGLDIEWDVDLYGRLLEVSGGKERMRHYFDQQGWPRPDHDALIHELHRAKTERFMELARQGNLPLRPGVKRLIDEALTAGLPVAVCSTSAEDSVRAVVTAGLGPERVACFAAIFAGDIVPRKKPAPDIYLLAAERLALDPVRTVVVEDTRVGLLAAKAAGMICVVTTSPYTRGEDFTGADMVVADLEAGAVTLETLRRLTSR